MQVSAFFPREPFEAVMTVLDVMLPAHVAFQTMLI